MSVVKIGRRTIGPGHPTYIIAELSGNHHQSYAQAEELLRAAASAGADAIKLQTYTADTLTISSSEPPFRVGKGTIWEGKTLYELYQEAYTPWEWQPRLRDLANSLGLDLFSTPFDESAVDFLENLGVPAYKVASFELVHLPLIKRIASTGKPLIMSTGMASYAEIKEAVEAAQSAGAKQIILLKCNSAYPAPPGEMNLRTIPDIADSFDVLAGLSDHTLDTAVPVAAVAIGARVIEKHICISRREGGPDSAFSLEPFEFAEMVRSVRIAERALGKVHYGPSSRESASLQFRRSIFVVQDMKAGEVFTSGHIRIIRPSHGLHPRHFMEVLGKRATRDLARGTPLSWEHVSKIEVGADADTAISSRTAGTEELR